MSDETKSNESNLLREVEFWVHIDDQNRWAQVRITKGYFHRWGEHLIFDEDGYKQLTVAIVEDNDGNVYRVSVGSMRFLEPLKRVK